MFQGEKVKKAGRGLKGYIERHFGHSSGVQIALFPAGLYVGTRKVTLLPG